MIRIGQQSRVSWAAKRASEAFGGMAAILLFVWLFRSILDIERYSSDIVVASLCLIFLGLVFNTRTNSGVARAVSSFMGNLTVASVIGILLIWFLEWIAGVNRFSSSIAGFVPDLAILAIAAGLLAFAAHRFSPRAGRTVVSGPLFVARSGEGPSVGVARIVTKRDVVGVPVKEAGMVVGCVLLGDVQASFNTPMGPVKATLTGPVATAWVPFEGSRLDEKEAQSMTGKTKNQLVVEARQAATQAEIFGHRNNIDLPFIHIEDSPFEEIVEVGPVRVKDSPSGGHVRIGPLSIDTDEPPRNHGKWLAKGVGDTYIQALDGRISAKWNGSLLSLDGGTMKLQNGSDSFSYSSAEVMTSSPMHTLRVTQDKISLDTRKFTLKVMGDTVVLRAEDKTRTTESKGLAGSLRSLLTETVKRQVGEVMEGVPIDLSEMLTTTEEVLTKA